MSDLGHNRHGPKRGGMLSGAGSWVPSNAVWPGPRSISVPSGILIRPAVWPQWTWAENWWGLCPLFGGKGWSPCNSKSLGPGLPPCQVSSWSTQPFSYNTPTLQTAQTDRQDRQARRTDNGPIAYGEPFYKRWPKNAYPNITKFSVHVSCGRGLVLLWRQCNKLCTSGFVDDVLFGHNRPGKGDA